MSHNVGKLLASVYLDEDLVRLLFGLGLAAWTAMMSITVLGCLILRWVR